MSTAYTAADVDGLFEGEFEIPDPNGVYKYTADDGSLWSLLKYQEVDNFPTELGVVSYVADYGGEGQGDDYWVVVKIAGHDGSERYFKKPGWYASYSGGELDGDAFEVKPTERVVTFYE